MKTLYIFIAAGGPAGGGAWRPGGGGTMPGGGVPGRTRRPDPSARAPGSGAARRGGGGRPRGAPAAARDPGLAGVTAPHSLRPLVPGGRPDPRRPAPWVRRAPVGSASRPRATLGKPPRRACPRAGGQQPRGSPSGTVPGEPGGGAGVLWPPRPALTLPESGHAPPGPRDAAVRPAEQVAAVPVPLPRAVGRRDPRRAAGGRVLPARRCADPLSFE